MIIVSSIQVARLRSTSRKTSTLLFFKSCSWYQRRCL